MKAKTIWWEDYNKVCLACKKKCKQSSKVKVVVCPLYEPKEKKK
jgi:hypothetical protein